MSDNLSADLASLRIDRGRSSGGGGGWGTVLVAIAAVAALILGATALAPWVEARFFKVEVELTEVISVSPAQAAVGLTATGYVIPQVTAKVGSKVIGRIAEAGVREGDVVRTGQVMFRVDAADQERALDTAEARAAATRAAVASARAAAAEIEVQLKRQERLLDGQATSAAIVDDLRARLSTLEAQADAAQAQAHAADVDVAAARQILASYVISAPMDGTIVNKPAAVGDVAFPEATLAELADFGALLIEADVPEARMSLVHDGGPCEIGLDAQPGERFSGVVVGVAPRLSRSKATATVKVRFDAPPAVLRPEMSARVSFLSAPLDAAALAAKPKTVLPGGAATERDGVQGVFVVTDGQARFVPIRAGDAIGAGVELLEGPPPGARVVKDPPTVLVDGQAVKEKSP